MYFKLVTESSAPSYNGAYNKSCAKGWKGFDVAVILCSQGEDLLYFMILFPMISQT